MHDRGGTAVAAHAGGLARVGAAAAVGAVLSVAPGLAAESIAYLAVALGLVLGAIVAAGRPAFLARGVLVLACLDAALISLLVYATGGGGSPFFALYFLVAAGMVGSGAPGRVAVGSAAAVLGYIAATAAADTGGLLATGFILKAGILALFCVGIVVVRRGVRKLEQDNQQLSSKLAGERSYSEGASRLISRFGPVLEMLDGRLVMEWTADMARELTGGAYGHVVLLDVNQHSTSMQADFDACPTWWHPAIQEMTLWSARNGKVLHSKQKKVHGLKGFIAVPIHLSGSEHGGAIVAGGGDFGAREERLLRVLAEQASVALRNVGEAPGGRDADTGLPNRSSLHRVLRRELRREGALTLISLRLDGGWTNGRTQGRSTARAVMRRVGEKLAQRQRVFQYGADEFFLLLRGRDLLRARQVALWSAEVVREVAGGDPVSPVVGYAVADPASSNPEAALAAARRSRGLEAWPQDGAGARSGIAEGMRRGIVAALFEAVSIHDEGLREHLQDVSRLARRVGERMNLSPEDLDTLTAGALLHDLGKIGVPDATLRKTSALSDREYQVVKRHVGLGVRILEQVADLSRVVPVVKYHHERFDGTGYPEGLRGADIPLLARIVVVVDAFDSMVRDRPYRRGLSRQAALAEIARHAGSQFDPRVARALLDVVEAPEERRSSSAG